MTVTFLLASLTGFAPLQDVTSPRPPPWVAEVDRVFANWDRVDSPGCALGIIQSGRLVHARGFGSASLEHGVAITPRTVFDIGSTSKQFTAAAIGLLVADDKLSVSDSIRAWIPELAECAAPITLDHCLHHTSGLPDYLGLMVADSADLTTPKEALDALIQVAKLDFAPGERFAYSNSNYFLLSLVAERASGTPFQDFVRTRIFEPLGMRATLLLSDHGLVIPHRATGYDSRKGGGFAVSMSDFEQLGDGAVQTCIEDLALWDANFKSKRVGGEALHSFLHERGTLADGSRIAYARGLFVGEFRGLPRVSHGGAWAGYRAELLRFPEQETSILCLSNLGSMQPSKLCEQVAAIVLGEALTAPR